MLLKELCEAKKEKGTYAGLRFTPSTIKNIKKLYKDFNIENSVPEAKLHSTLLFSSKYLPKYSAIGLLKQLIVGKPTKCEVWDTSDDEPKQALVLLYDSAEQVTRHKYLMKKHDAVYDYTSYKPHLTLSYDVGKDFDIKEINEFIKDNPFDIEINKEYQEDLDLDWKENNKKE